MAQKMSKKLPKRVSNDRAKSRRAASWARGQERKAKRREEQARREERNKKLRAQGLPTPWEAAKLKAKQKKKTEREAA